MDEATRHSDNRSHIIALRNVIEEHTSSNTSPENSIDAVVECACCYPIISAAAIFLYENDHELVTSYYAGDGKITPPSSIHDSLPGFRSGKKITYSLLIIQGVAHGWLAIKSDSPLHDDAIDFVEELRFYAITTINSAQKNAQINHFSDKLGITNEVFKLIASGVPLERIMRTLAREAAFRFHAACCMAMLLSEDKSALLIKGTYGAPPRIFPEKNRH